MKKSIFTLLAVAGFGLNAMAIDQVGGVYQINTPEDLVEFSAIVNSVDDRAAASLNADLDMSSVDNFTPIGLYSDENFDGKISRPYRGDFRGNGHVISHLNVVIANYEVGLFSRTASGANIHELGVVDSHFESTNGIRVGALGGEMHQTRVYACFGVNNEIVSTKGDDNKGGIAGEAADTNLERCYTDYARLAGSARATDWSHANVDMTVLKSGEFCYETLNNGHSYTPMWTQDLRNGGYPVATLNNPQVAKLLDGSGYTNDHNFVDGVCRECHDYFYEEGYMTADDEGYFSISTPEELMWFSVYTCHFHDRANGKLTADIDMSGIKDFYGIGEYQKENGENYPYHGNFNGQGHVISNLTVVRHDDLESGFFGRAWGSIITNLGFDGNISITNEGGVRAGVLGGELLECTINNVYVIGDITINTTHAQKGALGGEAHNSTFNNCYTTEFGFTGGGGTFNNCYNNASGEVDDYASDGYLCYLLGTGWYQNIDNGETPDEYPVLDPTHGVVYLTCGDEELSNYSGHTYVNGICSKCTENEAMGWDADLNAYAIGNMGQLNEFAKLVNSGNLTARGVLTQDIDLENKPFTPIGLNNDGSHQTPFRGVFYGNGHVVKNLNVVTDCEGGLFSRLRSGVIYNLGVENARIESTAGLRCGVIAGEHHDNAWMHNCFTRGDFEFVTDHEQKGGLSGEAAGGHFVNCYTTYPVLNVAQGEQVNCYEGVTEEFAKSGELCYNLNGDQSEIVFYQTLGEDAYPTFDSTHGTVYLVEGVYSNSSTPTRIENVAGFMGEVEQVYSVSGAKQNGLQKGINIVKMNDGTTKTILVK